MLRIIWWMDNHFVVVLVAVVVLGKGKEINIVRGLHYSVFIDRRQLAYCSKCYHKGSFSQEHV